MKDYYIKKFFNMAKNASKFSDFPKPKMGSVIVYKNRIIANGYNVVKENPLQKYYNKYRGFDTNTSKNTLHAEMMCILKIKELDIDYSKLHIFIYREYKDGSLALAKPCPACMQAIKDLGIKNVHYTGKDSFIYEKLK